MKSVITLLIALFLVFSMCSCNNNSTTDTTQNNESFSNEELSPEELALKEAEATLAAVEQEMEAYKTLSLREKAENYLSWDKAYWESVDKKLSEYTDSSFSSTIEQFRYFLMDQCAFVLEENGETDMQFIKEIANAYADCMILEEEMLIEDYESSRTITYLSEEMINDAIESNERRIENFESLKAKIDNTTSSGAENEKSDIEIMQELSTIFEELFYYENISREAYHRAEIDKVKRMLAF